MILSIYLFIVAETIRITNFLRIMMGDTLTALIDACGYVAHSKPCAISRTAQQLLANAVGDLPFLKPAVAVVLLFVGGKMTGGYFGYDIGTETSLLVISGLLSGGIALSVLFPGETREEVKDPGCLETLEECEAPGPEKERG